MSEGAHTVQVTVNDLCGNENTTSWTFTVDTILPAISDLMPADGACVMDSTPEICADYSDAGGIDTAAVLIEVDDVNVTGSATVTEGGVCYTPGASMSEGAHTVQVTVNDLCGNENTTSWAFTVDTIAPVIVFLEPPTPVNNSEITVDYVNVTVNVTDSGCGLEVSSVVLLLNGTAYSMTDIGSTYYREITELSNGAYTYRVRANDTAGNQQFTDIRVVSVNVTEIEHNFTIQFVTGYNLISLPVNDTSVMNASALRAKIGANTQEIYKWDKSNQSWLSYNQYMPPAAAFAIDGGDGYYVRMSGPADTRFSGYGWESPFVISLVTGYNLLGMPLNDTTVTNASSLLTKIGSNAQEVYKWDKSTQSWLSYNQYMPPAAAFALVGGEGYYLRLIGPFSVAFEGEPWEN